MRHLKKFDVENNSYEFITRNDREAKALIKYRGWEGVTKKEYMNRSRFNTFSPCEGTLKKIYETSKTGEKKEKLEIVNKINYPKRQVKYLKNKIPNSSKLSKSARQLPIYFRNGKFSTDLMSLFEAYKLPLRCFIEDAELTVLREGLRTELNRQRDSVIKFNKEVKEYKKKMSELQNEGLKEKMQELPRPRYKLTKNGNESFVQNRVKEFIQGNRQLLKERKKQFIKEFNTFN